MSRKIFFVSLLSIIAIFVGVTLVTGTQVNEPNYPTEPLDIQDNAITFQGKLNDGGVPADGEYDLQFTLHDDPDLESPVGSTIGINNVLVIDGLFTVVLDFGSVFDGTPLWIQIEVQPSGTEAAFVPLTPRQKLSSAPYASALPGLWTKGGLDSPNLIGGYRYNEIFTGVKGGAIGGGGEAAAPNKITDEYGTVAGGAANQAGDALGAASDARYATVGGGSSNQAKGEAATVGGGSGNAASESAATVAGGISNNAEAANSAVGGGSGNTASGADSAVGGGSGNSASAGAATVAGGTSNNAAAANAAVGGGTGNTAGGAYSAVGGGSGNAASQEAATVAGGASNTADAAHAAVGGGTGNAASGAAAVVGGGASNQADGAAAAIGGGSGNIASQLASTVAGGTDNAASAENAAVGGGTGNAASGAAAAVPGGADNTAEGDYSLAAGQRAKAYHDGSFVWADSTAADFASTAMDQFLVRASGGVNFNTNGAPFTVNGSELVVAGSPYANVVIVAKSGGDFTSIQAALNSIYNASASNPYLVWVAPGVYNETVTMKSYIDIEGAGESLTKITYIGGSNLNYATVFGKDNAELRSLTVENTGGTDYAIAIVNEYDSPHLSQVTAIASGGTNNWGILNRTDSSTTMDHVTAIATGGSNAYGIENSGAADPVFIDVTATASGATSSNAGIQDIWSDSLTMYNIVTEGQGGTSSHGFRSQSSTQIALTNVTAYASGAEYSTGLYSGYTNATLTNIVATGAGGTTLTRGVSLDSNASYTQTLTNVTATATGGVGTNYGVSVYGGVNATINNCTLSAVGGAANYGLYFGSGGSSMHYVTISNSQITGATATIRNQTNFTTGVGGTFLNGGDVDVFGGTLTCAGVYDETFTFSSDTCP